MASHKTQETPSPSASSIFLPLGRRSRRGSRASYSTQADREQLSEALDQAHHTECQSAKLTAFKDFTEPPVPADMDHKGLVGDLQGGLSGLYSKFRASVGGMRDMVGSSSRAPDSVSSDTPAVVASSRNSKTASSSNLTGLASLSSSEALALDANSAQASSKVQSPTVEMCLASQDGPSVQKVSRLPSKAPSVSSKSSILSRNAMKSPIASLTTIPTSATADPTVTELNVNAVKDALHHHRTNSGSLSINALQRADSPGLERRDSSLIASTSSLSPDPSVNWSSRSPELVAKSSRDHPRYREGLDFGEATRLPPARDQTMYERPSSPSKCPIQSDRSGLPELDTSLLPTHKKPRPADSDSRPHRETYQGNKFGSQPFDTSPVSTSVTQSTSKLSTAESSNQEGRTPTTLATSVSMTENQETTSAHSSKTSSRRQNEKPSTRISQPRLPGFELSRKTSSGTAVSHSTSSTQDNRALDQLSRHYSAVSSQGDPTQPFKNRLLSREFWMRDENAKDCFYCGEPFTTFRRKHHCRTCGQIFDAKCTSLVPGALFGHSGSVRLCRPCEAVIKAQEEDSTESSDDELSPVANPRHSETSAAYGVGARLPLDDDDSSSIVSQSIDQVLKTPTMAIPATRRTGDGNNRRSAILEIDSADRQLTRPTSSRSLRGSLNGRTHSVSHKRHHSRQQYIRNFKSYHDDRAPFQRRLGDDMGSERRLPAFHRDNIIDPDLAQYLSDDASSGDDQPNLFGVVSESALSKSNGDSERSTFGGLLAAVKKGRSRGGEKSGSVGVHGSRDGDDVSVTSSRAVNLPRSTRRRNLSVASSIHQRLSPRGSKDNAQSVQHDYAVTPFSLPGTSHAGGFKMTRSSSMRGAGAPPLELNRASLEHVRKLLRQLLKDASVPRANSWETALLPILLKATDDVNPDVQHGDAMDIRHYIKLKKIPGGRPGDTSYVSGLVFTKNVALKSMPRSISRPNILIIAFPLEYARQQQHFMSLEPVIRQEREFLENLVSRIAALRPNLLLVEKNVSGLALQLLEAANITTAYNVKPSVIEAVSRCTQAKIITSIDRLAASATYLGQCGSFDVKTYVHKARKKTYMYISGCPKELGCTIVLRGADNDVLAKVKQITEFMVYVVYNLKLETCLMRDEFAKIPSSPSETTNSSKTGLTKESSMSGKSENGDWKGIASQDGALDGKSLHIVGTDPENGPLPEDLPTPAFYEDIVQKHQTKLLSASPFVKFQPPYLLMRARELERQLAYLKRLRDQDFSKDVPEDEKMKAQKFVLITPEMIHESLSGAPAKVKEVLHAVHDAEYDRALYNYQTQKRQWETYISGNRNLFDPYAHQNIVVLYSLVCTTTSIPCSGPDIFALGFYNEHETDPMFEPDCTLGQYVEDLCHSANATCDVNGCEEKMFDHHRQYVHGEAQISIFVQPYPSKLRGMQDTILMWSCCKICGNETPPTPMSESTWKYSFGKYLELSFDSADLQARAGVCPHDLHRDHLRYFGYKDMALRIHYDPINLLEIIVPRPRVTWKVEKDLKLRNEIYTVYEQRLTRFMTSVKTRLKSIKVESVMPEMAEDCRKEIEALTKRADEEHQALIKQHQERYMNSKYWEIVPLSKLIHATQEKFVEWDAIFTEFEKKYFPSEKDIKRLATLQLKKIFLDRDVSGVSLTPIDEGAATPAEIDESARQTADSPKLSRRLTLSAQEAKNVLASVVEEEHSGKSKETLQGEAAPPVPPVPSQSESHAKESVLTSRTEIQHLDPAIPSDTTKQISSAEAAVDTTANKEPEVEPSTSVDTAFTDVRLPESVGVQKPGISEERQEERVERRHTADEITQSISQGPPIDLRSSGIPKPPDRNFRRGSRATSPPLFRSQSQPAQLLKTSTNDMPHPQAGCNDSKQQETDVEVLGDTKRKGDKRLSERFGLSSLKSNKVTSGHSFIPRSVKKASRVSSLAKHFEQLSREFEKERQRERQQRAARGKQVRAYPMASSNPIVQVYKNVKDAVEEREPSDEGLSSSNQSSAAMSKESSSLAGDMVKDVQVGEEPQKVLKEQEQQRRRESEQKQQEKTEPVDQEDAKPRESDESQRESSRGASDGEEDDLLDELQMAESPDEAKLSPVEVPLDLKELPKHERSFLVKMLTSFWAERSASSWTPLDYPLSDAEHVFADSDIIIREDEPSSLIAFALDSEDYKQKLASFQEQHSDAGNAQGGVDGARQDPQLDVEQSLLRNTGTHLKYQFQEGPAKMLCKVFYAEQFDALRRKCGVSERIVDSLSRCLKWDSKGGKTKSLFLKTLDERFILKSLSTVETQAFLKFAPAYFQIMSEALFHEMPSAIAKMFGFYQVIVKNPATGVDYNWFLLLMENLFYDRSPTRIFDLKGSMRNRKVQSTGERDEVLLDENMVEYIYESPLFAREHSKKLLSQSVWNDTLFLARQNVMDYSLMIAIDENRQELVVGIIDCIRTYTWDKKLESWIKDRGFAGGGKNRPTVTSPKEYKSRFREAMARYVLHAPNPWHQVHPGPVGIADRGLVRDKASQNLAAGDEEKPPIPDVDLDTSHT
ncbi:hypothetical protein VTO42DRAFT_5714 [Malbranchea cinnamomea]